MRFFMLAKSVAFPIVRLIPCMPDIDENRDIPVVMKIQFIQLLQYFIN